MSEHLNLTDKPALNALASLNEGKLTVFKINRDVVASIKKDIEKAKQNELSTETNVLSNC